MILVKANFVFITNCFKILHLCLSSIKPRYPHSSQEFEELRSGLMLNLDISFFFFKTHDTKSLLKLNLIGIRISVDDFIMFND